MADDVSSPERMDFSEESSFEASPLNQITHRHTRSNQQVLQRNSWHGNRRMSCPPPLSPFGAPLCNSQTQCSKRKSTGDFLDMIGKGFTGMQLESPPGDLRRHHTLNSVPDTSSNALSESSKSFFSLPSFGLGSMSPCNHTDKTVDDCSDDSDTTIVSGSSLKHDSNNNGKMIGTSKQAGLSKRVSQRVCNLSAIIDHSDSAENDEDDDRLSTVSKSSNKTTQPQRNQLKEHARLSNRKGRCICYLHSLVLCSTIVIISYFGSQEMHKQWCSSRQLINVTKLQQQLDSEVFGQHVATDLIVKVFQGFRDGDTSAEPIGNVAVFSFHGWTGVGKNYISNIIADLIPSGNVIKLIIPLHFPYPGLEYSRQYKENIEQWILSNISDCSLNLFVIDEMDKAGKQLVQGLQNAIEAIKSDKLSDKKVVILLLSNTGGTLINKVLFDHLHGGFERETLMYDTLQEAVLKDPITTWHKELYEQNQIDYIVPFLPLQRHHVEMCIRKYLNHRSIALPTESIKKIVEDLEYFPPGNPVFSKSGCKRVESKTDLYI